MRLRMIAAGLSCAIGLAPVLSFAQPVPPGPPSPPPDIRGPAPNPPGAPPPGPPPGMPPSPPIGPVSVEPNTDRPGQDFSNFAVPQANPDVCRLACESERRCVAYTYVHPGLQGPNAVCWLKAAVPPPVQNTCCISGKR